jgi:hypothetical protein
MIVFPLDIDSENPEIEIKLPVKIPKSAIAFQTTPIFLKIALTKQTN